MRSCENCDHLMVCAEVKDRLNRLKEDGNVNNIAACNHWSGWHDLKEDPEDLPKNSKMVLTFAFGMADLNFYNGGWYTESGDPVAFPIRAWHPQPKWEGSKE